MCSKHHLTLREVDSTITGVGVDHQFLGCVCSSDICNILHFVKWRALVAEHLVDLTIIPSLRRDPRLLVTFPPLILKFPLEFWMKLGRLPPLLT